MKRIIQAFLFTVLLLLAARNSLALLIMKPMHRAEAERFLGVVLKREYLGIGPATNEAGISIEFAPKDELENFLSIELHIYQELPAEEPNGVHYRRLAVATLKPLVQTQEKVRAFFSVDPEYLERTEIVIRVRNSDPAGCDGYMIRLDRAFPIPEPKKP